jgi:preprotein translocase subunit SecG
MIHSILIVVLVICSICIIALVLLQRGKGADAGAGFGAGASGTVFGARGATTALSRATAILAGVFMVTCLLLSYVVTRSSSTQQSELDRIASEVQSGSNVPAVPAPAAVTPDQVPVVPAQQTAPPATPATPATGTPPATN